MDPPTCALAGAMAPLLRKLDSVMAPGNTLAVEVKDELELLVQAIKKIHTPLVDLLYEAEDPPLIAKLWMKGVRELSYDMEDYFDQVMHSGSGSSNNGAVDSKPRLSPRAPGQAGFVKISRLYKTRLKRRSPMATKIMEFIARVQDAYERYKRYDLDSMLFDRRFVSHGPPRRPIHRDQQPDYGPLHELDCKLDTSGQTQLKVVSIVGPGGVGKTTLARRLYHKLRGQFECQAFVQVTAYPDMRRLLTGVFVQIQRQQPHMNWDIGDLIDSIAQNLAHKRYFIVIDDIWTESLWDIVSQAFPKGSCCSRIITTTQVEDVALACCSYVSEYILEMRPLNEKHSQQLFFSKVFGCEDDCPKEFKEVSYEIIRQCGGLPLSIVNIANLFESEPVLLIEHWKQIQCSLSSSSWMNPSYMPEQRKEVQFESSLEVGTPVNFTRKQDDLWFESASLTSELLYTNFNIDGRSEGMKSVLYIIYNNLPPHLKEFLLYFHMYPADYIIKKDDLVKQWTAEGFLSLVEGHHREQVVEGYFDDLISRGMIQPVETNCNGQVLSCTVHHMVLDLIGYKCMENNFITIVDYFQTSIGFLDKVRRLSVHFGGATSASMPAGIMMSQVRSLTFFGFISCVPSIVQYKHLRVLNFDIWANQDNTSFDLARICELFLLRYLKIRCNTTVKLPAEMQGLQFLETLEVDAEVDAVPSDIVHLQRLLHLHFPCGTAFPDGICHMTPLRTLGSFYLTSSLEINLLNLGMLTNLQDLHITCPTAPSGRLFCNMDFVGSILGRLKNIRSLSLVPGSVLGSALEVSTLSKSNNGWNRVPIPPALIERLDLLPRIIVFSSLPTWIRPLDKLYDLKIAVRDLSSSDIDLLKKLPSLTALSLHVLTTPSTTIIIGQEGFPNLRFLTCLTFRQGAMPTVERIKLRFCVNEDGFSSCVNAGLENLTRLKEISAKVWPDNAGYFNKRNAEKAEYDLKATIKEIVETPMVNVRCVQAIASPMILESSSSSTIEEFNKIWNKPLIVTENAMVTASLGAMNSVLAKLGTLMGEPYSRHPAAQVEAMTLNEKLGSVDTILEQQADTVDLKDSRNKLREMTYDIEDWIDDLIFHFDHKGTQPKQQKFSDQIQNLVEKLDKAASGSKVHKAEVRTLGSTYYVASESRLSCRFSDKGTCLVGLDGPRDLLVQQLTQVDPGLLVVCIVGSPGVGKTTLANEVYKRIRCQFDREKFLTVSKKLNIGEHLEVLGLPSCYFGINNLQDKRYLLVIDGVWSPRHIHESIKPALPNNRCGSRIIITTCDNDVAESCGQHFASFIYQMETLTFDDSLSLFRSTIFGSGRSCPTALEKTAEKIVKACSGVPFAITVMAGVLASKPAEVAEWEMVEKLMALSLSETSLLSIEGIRKLLYISYSDLPRDAKTCLLYLSAFYDNHLIMKDRLIRRWMSEGFLPKINEENSFETGERYFVELISRKLIEPVFWEDVIDYELVYNNKPLGCEVRGLVHDFITPLSSQANLLSSSEGRFVGHDDVIRRLYISCPSCSDYQESDVPSLFTLNPGNESKLRSLFTYSFQKSPGNYYLQGTFPDLSAFRRLQVLDLEGNIYATDSRLGSIGGLPLLRYLGLGETRITQLFGWILALKNLETLDLRRTPLSRLKLPQFANTKLVSLLADNVEITEEQGETQELEELSMVLLDSGDHFVPELVNKSKRMRTLGLRFSYSYDGQKLEDLFGEIVNSGLRSLCLDDYPEDFLDILWDYWARGRPRNLLRVFDLRICDCLPKVPQDMVALKELTHLRIEVEGADAGDFLILGNLPNLISLELSLHGHAGPRRCMVSNEGFRCLKVFRCTFSNAAGLWLEFDAEAMPQLRWLEVQFNAGTTKYLYDNFDIGIQHLSSLTNVTATTYCYRAKVSDVEAAEAAIRDQVSLIIPNNPTIEFRRVDPHRMIMDEGQHS